MSLACSRSYCVLPSVQNLSLPLMFFWNRSLIAAASLWLAACASAPTQVPTQTLGPFQYAPDSSSSKTTYTVHRPQDAQRRPGVLLIHGGGWSDGEPEDLQRYAERVVAAGWVAINMGYRLAPDHLWPAQREDLLAIQADLHARATELGLDSSRIAVLGYSAGAHLAAQAALAPNPRVPPPVALIGGAGPYDLTRYPDSRIVRTFLGGVPAAVGAQTYRDASPLFKVSPAAPPTYLWHGTWDTLVGLDQSRDLARALQAAGVEVVLKERFGRGHITNFLLDDEAWEEIRVFIAEAFASP